MIAYRIWQIAGWTMLHYLWVGAALGAGAMLLRLGIRSAAVNVRYLAALAGLLLMAAAPAVIAAVVAHRLPPPPTGLPLAVAGQSPEEAIPAMPLDLSASDANVAGTLRVPSAVPDANVAGTRRVPSTAWRFNDILDAGVLYLPWLWLIGSPIALLLTTLGMAGAERLRRQSRPVEDAAIADLCRRLAAALRISRRVGVAVCDRIASPVLVGIVRPLVLLPAVALAGWDPQQLEMVLLHELLHVRRWDNLVNLVQRIVESLLFFHPMIWVVSAWVRREREHCCDAAVIAHTRQPQAYARLLVALADQVSRNPLASVRPAYSQVVASMAQPSLVARIRRILKKEEPSMQVSQKTISALFTALLTLGLMIGVCCCLPGRAEAPAKGFAHDSATKAVASPLIPPEVQTASDGKLFTAAQLLDNWSRGCRSVHSYDLYLTTETKSLLSMDGNKKWYAPKESLVSKEPSHQVLSNGKRRIESGVSHPGNEATTTIVWDGQAEKVLSEGQWVLRSKLDFTEPDGIRDYELLYGREWIPAGEGLPEMMNNRPKTKVEGREGACFLLYSPSGIGPYDFSPFGFRVWLDSAKNFMPARIQQLYTEKGKEFVYAQIDNDLKQVRPGVWLPAQSTISAYLLELDSHPREAITTVQVDLKLSKFNSEIPASVFQLEPPAGSRIVVADTSEPSEARRAAEKSPQADGVQSGASSAGTTEGAAEHIARARAALRKCADDNATGQQRQFVVDSDQALAECDKALEIDPQSAEAYCVRGRAWTLKHEYKKAIADLDKAIAINSKSAEAYSNRGDARLGLDDLDKALADCDKALSLDPKLAEAHFTRGMVFTRKAQLVEAHFTRDMVLTRNDREEAVTEFRRTLAIAPERLHVLNNLGVSCWILAQKQQSKAAKAEQAGDVETAKACRKKSAALKDEAMGYWQRGIAANPNSSDIVRNLQTIAENPNNMAALQLLTKLHYERGEYAEGEKCLQSWLAKLRPAVRQEWASQFVKELDQSGHHEAAVKARAAVKLLMGNTGKPAKPKVNDSSGDRPAGNTSSITGQSMSTFSGAPAATKKSPAKPADKAATDKEKLSGQWRSAEPRLPPGYLLLPAYRYLGNQDVRKHYGIDAAQEKKLREIAAEYRAAQEKILDVYKEAEKLSPRERGAKVQELAAQDRQARESSRKKIDDFLTAAQKAAYRHDRTRDVAVGLSTDTEQVAKSFGIDLSEQQKQQFQQVKEEVDENIRKRIAAAGQRLLAVLTPQQRERLMPEFSGAPGAQPGFYVPPIEPPSNKISGFYFAGPRAVPFGFQFASRGGASVWAYQQLADAAVRKELALTAVQETKLRAIQAKSQAAAQMIFDRYEPKAGGPKLSLEEQKKQRAAYEQALITFGNDLAAQIDAVLQPRQVAALKTIARKDLAIQALMGQDRAVLDDLHVTDDQRAKLRRIYEGFTTPDFASNRATGEKAWNILTPQQRKKLDEAIQRYGL